MKLKVEIADTPSKQTYGLMYRRQLDHDGGMLFSFGSERVLSFWGVNTYIPLDIAFIDSGNKIVDIKEIVPLSNKRVSSSVPCKYALEVNNGFFKDHNIGIGHMAKISGNEVIFENEDV